MPIRLPAQWEKQEFIMLVFPYIKSDWKHSIKEIRSSYIRLIEVIIKYQKCVILSASKQEALHLLPKPENIEVLQVDTDDTWIRDFGGICIYKDGKLEILNFKFNAWGEKFGYKKDNRVNIKLNEQQFFKSPLRDIDFVLEGGSIDTNGKGVLLSTQNCIFNKNRNPNLSKEQIIDTLKTTLGAKEMIILKNGTLIGDDTDSHVDTLARFVDTNTIAYVKCYDKNDEHYDTLDRMENELKATNFKLLPLPLPLPKYFQNRRLPATYLNFIFINGALVVPTYKDKNDKIALKILQDFFKDRDVIGVDASIFIREHGSLHCSTMNFYKELA